MESLSMDQTTTSNDDVTLDRWPSSTLAVVQIDQLIDRPVRPDRPARSYETK